MFNSLRNRLTGLAQRGAQLPVPARAGWQRWATMLSMLALLVMLFAAGSHQHAYGGADEDNCIVCTLAFDTLDQIPVIPALVESQQLANFYYVRVATPSSLIDVFHSIPPPSCGPPLPLA